MTRDTPPVRFPRLWFAVASAVLFVLYFVITYYFFGSMRHAKLVLVDDHEILRFIGPDHHIELTDIPGILFHQTEVGQWGTADRLRPVYYSLRIIESALWRDNAALWYLTRMALVALTAFGMSVVVLRGLFVRPLTLARTVLNLAIALVFGSIVVSFPAWQEIATRLGPSEIYVSAGVVLFVVGATELWRRPDRTLAWIILFVGYVVIVGSKEDGIAFAVPLAAIYLLKFWSSRRKIVNAVLGVVAAGFTIYVTLGVLISTGKAGGADLYGNTRSIDGLTLALSHNAYLLAVVCFFLFTVALELVARPMVTRPILTSRRLRAVDFVSRFPLSLASAVCIYIVLMEAYFYQDYTQWIVAGVRYAFLTDFATSGSFIIMLVAVAQITVTARAVRVLLAVTAIAVIGASPLVDNIVAASRFHQESLTTAVRSRVVSSQIQSGVADLAAHRDSVALLLVDKPLEYEPLFSLPQFLAYYGKTEAVYVSVKIPEAQYVGQVGLLRVLGGRMTQMARTGKHTGGWRILPAKQRNPGRYTVCFYFGATPANLGRCDSSHQVG